MNLLPPYDKLLGGEMLEPAPPKTLPILVTNASEGQVLFDRLSRSNLVAIAVAVEFDFESPAIVRADGSKWFDRRSIRPASLAIAYRHDGSVVGVAHIDLTAEGIVPVVERILRLRVPFIAHGLKDALQSLWALGVDPDIPQIVDTQIVAMCLNLGRFSPRRHQSAVVDIISTSIKNERALDDAQRYEVSLAGQCARYDLGYPFSDSPEERREARLRAPARSSRCQRQSDLLADAEWTLKLYFAQQPDILNAGLAHHLYTVEFRFAVANARMEWRGVNVDRDRCRSVRSAAIAARDHHAEALAKHGITNPDDIDEVCRSLQLNGLLPDIHCSTLNDDLLRDLEDQDPVVAELRQYRKARSLVADDLFAGLYYGADGRVHPQHVQLGAATGRNTCVSPNVASISRRLRPVVTAPPRRALIELDYGQFEIGVAAAEHDDADLIAAYNDGDVYVAMAKRFYRVGHGLDVSEFKKRHDDLRDAMKTMVLAVIYNIGPRALAKQLDVDLERARAERAKFLDTFPALKAGLERSRSDGLARGYATTISGLRRRVEWPITSLSWTKNFLSNTPIQGSAAVVFKRAIIDLDAAFRKTNTWLILPIHDAVLIECDIDMIDDAARAAVTIMKAAMRFYYPRLEPRVEVNRLDPTCWNKDGDARSIFDFVNRFTPSSCESSS